MMEDKRKKIYLKAYCHGNLGDDLFVRIICERYPDVQFYVSVRDHFYHGMKDITNLNRIHAEGIGNRIDSLHYRLTGMTLSEENILKDCDAAVLLGGSMFMQNENWKSQLKSNRRLSGKAKRFYVIGANFGPYRDEEFRLAYHDLFAKADGVCFRDRNSYDLFQDIPSVRMAADVVFQLKNAENIDKEEMLSIIPIDLSRRRQLSRYHDAYVDAAASICREALQSETGVNLLSFCTDQGDERVIGEILNRMSKEYRDQVHTVFYRDSSREITDCISRSRYVLATRFHGMILGFLSGCRVLPIVYDIKTENYLKDLEAETVMFYPETIQQLSLQDVTESPLIDVSAHIRHAAEQFADLDQILKK